VINESDIVAFDGLSSPVAFKACKMLFPMLATVLRDWPMRSIDSDSGLEPVIRLEKVSEHYERRSAWLPNPARFRDPVDVVCDFIVDFVHAYVAEQEKLLCLHGAAVELQSGLMVFPNTYRAGKSILSLSLVSLGARLFSDDVLPIDHQTNSGVALGILPRLRRPLPATAGSTLTDFIEQRCGPQNKRYRYIRLADNELVRRGTKAPVAAITILKRSSETKASLQSAPQSEVVRDMILRNFARQNPAIEIVDRLHAIVEQAQCYTLTYDSLDQAAELLENAFGICPVGIAT
jgi:hypothetical protein